MQPWLFRIAELQAPTIYWSDKECLNQLGPLACTGQVLLR
ncbi:MAG: hypothetical protein ACI9F9_000947 [Candidatus Paceibacteria bacterium]|jgi:hypothetical protein